MWFKQTCENFIYEPSKSPLPKNKSSLLGRLIPMTFLSNGEDTTLYHFAQTPHQTRDHDNASWTNALRGSVNWGWKYLRDEWVRTKLLRRCPAFPISIKFSSALNVLAILLSYTDAHGWFVPASPACPSKSFSCSSETLHIARSKNLVQVADDSTSNLLESSSYLASHLPGKCYLILYTSLLRSEVEIIRFEIAKHHQTPTLPASSGRFPTKSLQLSAVSLGSRSMRRTDMRCPSNKQPFSSCARVILHASGNVRSSPSTKDVSRMDHLNCIAIP